MNALSSALAPVVSRALFPWLVAAGMLALSAVGVTGMYAGYEIASARNAEVLADLKDAQIVALKARASQYEEAVKRSDQVSTDFFTALKNLHVVNKTITAEVRHEVEKLVYTDCKVPDSGAELLGRKVDALNLRLLGTSTGDKK